MTAAKEAPAPVPTIKHGQESAHARDNRGSIPVYEVSEWAVDKSLGELDAELDRRKNVARAEGQLLDHEFTTLEWLAAERRSLRGRSAADIAAEPTDDERKAFDKAAAAFSTAASATADAKDALEAAIRARIDASQGSFGASSPTPDERRKLVDDQDDAKAAVEDAREAEGVALVEFQRVQSINAARSQARRREAQAGINREGFLANVNAFGGIVDKADLERHYPQPGRLQAAVTRLLRRRRP